MTFSTPDPVQLTAEAVRGRELPVASGREVAGGFARGRTAPRRRLDLPATVIAQVRPTGAAHQH